jgi:hypothetical protein
MGHALAESTITLAALGGLGTQMKPAPQESDVLAVQKALSVPQVGLACDADPMEVQPYTAEELMIPEFWVACGSVVHCMVLGLAE